MSRKLISAQKPFKILVANLAKGSDPSRGPSGNPVKVRQSFTLQHFIEIPGRGPEVGTQSPQTPGIGTRVGHVAYTTSPIPVLSEGTITVATDVFTGPTQVHLGPYVLVSGIDYVVGGGTAATATSLATAIDALPGYSATPAGSDVTVTGPAGVIGNEVAFYAGGSSPQNFTFDPVDGTLAGAEPTLGPPVID